jgi:hypothetical protein
MKDSKFLPTRMIILITALLVGTAVSQTPSAPAPKPAANAWMLTPTPYLAWNQDIPASVRAQRDRFWDELSGRDWPLTVRPDGAVSTGEDFWDTGTEPEITELPNRTILTAIFTKYRSVLSASEFSIYTEVTMHVEEVFEDQTGLGHLVPHADITIMLNGGTVSLRSGRILSDNTQPRDLFLQPGHRYLLLLSYNNQGDWYECDDSWDISDGIVRANTPRTQYLTRAGRSSLNGLTVQQLGPALEKLLYELK